MSVEPVHVTVHPVVHAGAAPSEPVKTVIAPTASVTNVKDDGHDVAIQTLTLPGYLGPILLKH